MLQGTTSYRSGKQNRINLDRYFHIMNDGWFLYLRQEHVSENNDKIAGPFTTKQQATEFLENHLYLKLKNQLQTHSPENTDDSENWRY